jgi:hypothetical protein
MHVASGGGSCLQIERIGVSHRFGLLRELPALRVSSSFFLMKTTEVPSGAGLV